MNQQNSTELRPEFGSSAYLGGRIPVLSYFILAILGFSFWFFMVVPLASHRETYSWLAGIETQTFVQQFSFGLSSTYRPLAQIVTWTGFVILDPHIFPTSVLRQAFLQLTVYSLFVLGWWLIYSKAPLKRLLAAFSCISGGVFFPGYIHLFHIYGMFYVPVLVMLGALLYAHHSETFQKNQILFAGAALLLTLWHPFATGLFLGYYFGFYLDTFKNHTKLQHIQALAILFLCTLAILAAVIVFPRNHMPLDTKMLGFLVSYQTNEVNKVASVVAFLFTLMVVFSIQLPSWWRALCVLAVCSCSIFLFWKGLPLLLLWVAAVLLKGLYLRRWSIFFLTLAAAFLPLGGGIGSPAYVLFIVIMSVYVTTLDWARAEQSLNHFSSGSVWCVVGTAALTVLLVRADVQVPVITKVASPILTERERTYQLEGVLEWLHGSRYCDYEIDFLDSASSPIYDVQSAITRRNRPPAWIKDVRLFWDSCLKCQQQAESNRSARIAMVTFGDSVVQNAIPIFVLRGRYAGNATVWIKDAQ